MRDETRPTWPRRFPVYRLGALLLALLCGALLIRARILFAAPLERFYLRTYVTLTFFGGLPSAVVKTAARGFPVAFSGRIPATDFLLAHSRAPLSVRLVTLEPTGFHDWLQAKIYGGRTVVGFFLWPPMPAMSGKRVHFVRAVRRERRKVAQRPVRGLQRRQGRQLRRPKQERACG